MDPVAPPGSPWWLHRRGTRPLPPAWRPVFGSGERLHLLSDGNRPAASLTSTLPGARQAAPGRAAQRLLRVRRRDVPRFRPLVFFLLGAERFLATPRCPRDFFA